MPGPRQAQRGLSPRRTRNARTWGTAQAGGGREGWREGPEQALEGHMLRSQKQGWRGPGTQADSAQGPDRGPRPTQEDTGLERRGREPAPPPAWARLCQLWVGGHGGVQKTPTGSAGGTAAPAPAHGLGTQAMPPLLLHEVPFHLGTPALSTFVSLLTSAS